MSSFTVRQSIEAMEEYAVESVAADIIVNANESNYQLPQEIAEKITQRTARFPFNRYPPIKSENLCEVIAKELDVDIDCVKIGNGSSELLEKACYVFGGPGKKIAVPWPSFSMYGEYAALSDSEEVRYPLTAEGFVDADSVISFCKEQQPSLLIVCNPNNPTGATITREQLQEWVDYANRVGAVIIYDAAYEAYITEEDIPHSIYECKDARNCAIELHSFSKNAGFTGVRLGYTVVPKDLKCGDVKLHDLWARRHGTKYNGAPYIVQRAGEAVYSETGKAQLKAQVDYYMRNASVIYEGLKNAGYSVSGGINAPYVWLKTPDHMSSWDFFDKLLHEANVVGTPGSGFGAHGEGYFRLSAFGTYENTVKAVERIAKM